MKVVGLFVSMLIISSLPLLTPVLPFQSTVFSPNESLWLDVALASNVSNSNLPLNASRLQISVANNTLGEDLSNNQYALLTTLIASGSAIGGGVIGSILTSRNTKKIEKYRYETAKELEEDKRAQQLKEEEGLNTRIRDLVFYELVAFSSVLGSLRNARDNTLRDHRGLYSVLIGYQREYGKISLEKRAKIFNKNTLSKIEIAYQIFSMFAIMFEAEVQRYFKKEIDIEELKRLLSIESVQSRIDDTIKLMEEEYHYKSKS